MTNPALATVIHNLRRLAESHGDRRETDKQLLERFLADRDEAAFAALVRRHGRLVLSACRRVLSDEADVEDAFQATFLVLLRRAPSIRWQASVGNWLFGVAHRIAVQARANALRRRNREAEAGRRRPELQPPAELSWREGVGLLHEELDRLPDAYRLPLLLCYLDGKTRDETAQALGCSVGAIKGRLERGREMLRGRLIRRGLTLSGALLAALVDTPSGTSAPLPHLVRTTLQAAVTGKYHAPLAALLRGAAPAVFTGKLRIAAGLLLMTALLAAGGGIPCFMPRAAEPSSAPHANRATSRAAAAKPADTSVTVRGRIVGPDGKPVQGARLYTARMPRIWPHSNTVVTLAQQQPTGTDGRFNVTVKRAGPNEYAYVIAHAAGFGVDWLDLGEEERAGEVTFRLPKDVPINGRIVNTEGRPVAGVSVSAAAVYVPANEKLDDYLNGWLRNLQDNFASPRKRLYVPLDSITGAVKTGKDGRFVLRGAGDERIVHVTFAGGGVARSMPYVITRPGFDAKPYNAVLGRKEYEYLRTLNRFLGLYPPSFTFIAELGRTVEGVVKDAATGKPLPGCRLYALTSFGDGVAAVSDAKGAYHLDGVPKNPRGYGVNITPPKDGAYLRRRAHAADTEGFTKVRLDIELTRGVTVTGRVVNRQTGKGVQSYIRLAPLPDNAFLASQPGFDEMPGETDPDGRFRLVNIPGKAFILARVGESEKWHGQRLGVYRRAAPDPDHKDLFQYDKENDTWIVRTARNLEFLGGENAVKVIDVKESGETKVELSVDRGVTARIAVRDAAGQPLAGAWAAGLTDSWPITYKLPEAMATVFALNPAKPRRMAFFHAEKNLGGTAMIRGDEKEPVVVRLAPVGRVFGRLLDMDGNPLDGVEVSINARTPIGNELYRFAKPIGARVVTGKDGRFVLEGVVPNLEFGLGLRRGRNFFVGVPRIGLKQVKPGEALDLGDLHAKPAPEP